MSPKYKELTISVGISHESDRVLLGRAELTSGDSKHSKVFPWGKTILQDTPEPDKNASVSMSMVELSQVLALRLAAIIVNESRDCEATQHP